MDAQQPKQPSELEILLLLAQMSDAFKTMASNVAALKGFDFGSVVSYEAQEFDELDEDEKPTGQTFKGALITLHSGKEIILREDENAIFRKYWNTRCKFDNTRFGYASQVFNQMFPDPPKQVEPAK